ncbi:MAG TPA: polysaccharide biosynthesis protein [Candidatus Fimenecus excrementigallinarum]|uniref:Polysaccharide biosynthesis protein n=1 Tax=Candidatus Fimenecus excrementigallinarum TaxID=2840816 RepID=A0A9D1IGD6_9FIRM|nr:polysaccharide biosynthesis protein [Candidatus Fimenecus excrementigallinarum]
MAQQKRKSQSLLNGAIVLAAATILVKIIGILYKVPISNMIGTIGRGCFDSAYNLYIPIYTVSMAGLPVAVSKMVSQQVALGRFRDVRRIYKVAGRLFLLTGTVGVLLMFALAYPYAVLAKNLDALPAIIAIAPSIFFCCIMSTYRGYYNGLRNMTPTAMSEVWEAVGKVIVGLLLAWATMRYGEARFAAGLPVFGQTAATEAEALSAMYPYAAAAAALGVTGGTVVGMVYMMIRHRVRGDGLTRTELVNSPKPLAGTAIAKTLMAIAIPVVASSLVFSVTNLIDSITVQNRLDTMIQSNLPYIQSLYGDQLAASQVLDADIAKYLYGAYTMSLDFKNLIPSITLSLGVSAIPALSAAWAVKDHKALKVSVESVLRVTLMIALPAGIGMAVLAEPILDMMYETGKSADAVSIAAPIMAAYGYTIFLMCLSQPTTNMLQALGKTGTPLRSLTVGAVAKVIANYIFIGIPEININGAVIGTVICYTIIVLWNIAALLRTARVRVNWASVFVKPLFAAVLCGVSAFTSYGLFANILPDISRGGLSVTNVLSTGIAVIFAVFVYAVAMLLVGGIAKSDVKMLPKGEKIAKLLAKYGFLE